MKHFLFALGFFAALVAATPARAQQYIAGGTPGGLTPSSVTGSGLWYSTSGTLNAAALLGTAGQGLYVNAAGTQVAFATCSGDVTCSATVVGQNNIISIASLAGGTVTVGDGAHATGLTWANGSTPTLSETATSTNSATGQTFTIQAQNATGTTSNGGPLVLQSGTGTTAAGSLLGKVGATTALQLDLASTDFLAMGGSTNAAAGLFRMPNNVGTILAERNSANTGDLPLFSTPDVNGNWAIGASTGATASGASTIYVPNTLTIRGASIASGNPVFSMASGTYWSLQTDTGTPGTVPGFGISNNTASDWALTFNPTYNGTTTIAFGEEVTSSVIGQAIKPGNGATNGVTMAITAQQGQAQTGGAANNNGGTLALSSGLAGTGGSGAAGAPGALALEVGTVPVSSYNCGVPVTGIAHSAGATTLCTVPQATSASVTVYEVQAECKATTLFTGGSATDTFATRQTFAVRNVAGTLTNVASVTADTSTQSDSSVSTNALGVSISGTNISFQITPPTSAAGVETCSAVARVAQVL